MFVSRAIDAPPSESHSVAWSDETWLLYGYSVSRHNPPAKVAAFMTFVASLVDEYWKTPRRPPRAST